MSWDEKEQRLRIQAARDRCWAELRENFDRISRIAQQGSDGSIEDENVIRTIFLRWG